MSDSDAEEEESSMTYSHIESTAGSPEASVAAKATKRKRPIVKKKRLVKLPSKPKPKPKSKKARAEERTEKEAAKKERKKAAAAIGSMPGTGHRKRTDVEFDPDIHKVPQILHARGTDGKGKAPNYLDVEDVVLCRACIAGTLNPKKGAYQKEDVFWSEIQLRYNKLLTDSFNPWDLIYLRVSQSLKLRWNKIIVPSMNKFIKCYRHCYANKKSGETDEDILNRACDDWEEQEGSPFKYKHCVLVLKEGSLPQYDPGEELADTEKGISNPGSSNAVDGNVMGAGLVPKLLKLQKFS
jgi:hypothetical protein